MSNETKALFEKYAIFQTGGKQLQAIPGKTIAIEKIDGDAGDSVEFNEVLFRKKSEDNMEIGQPFVDGAIVKASIIKHMKDPKVIIFKFGRRKKLRTKKGHRQPKTVIRIEEI